MCSGFEYDTVYAILIKFENSCCPTNAVTFGNGKDNRLDGLLAVI